MADPYSFTPPIEQHVVDEYTKILLHLNPDPDDTEILTNPGLENWTGLWPATWGGGGHIGNSINKDTVDVHTGLNSMRWDIAATPDFHGSMSGLNIDKSKSYTFSFWRKHSTPGTLRLFIYDDDGNTIVDETVPTSDVWGEYSITVPMRYTLQLPIWIYFEVKNDCANSSIWVDDFSLKRNPYYSIADEIPGHTWSLYGNAVLDTGIKKFGATALHCNSVTFDSIFSSAHADYTIASLTPFAVDFWANIPVWPSTLYFCEYATSEYPMWQMWLSNVGNLGFFYYPGSPTNQIKFWGTVTPIAGEWYHVAVTAKPNGSGRDFRLFWNGNQVPLLPNGLGFPGGWFYPSTKTISTPTSQFFIGRGYSNYSHISIDEFRLSIGDYRWPIDEVENTWLKHMKYWSGGSFQGCDLSKR